MNKKNLERIAMKIETMRPTEPNYYTSLYVDVYVLAGVLKREDSQAKLKQLYDKTAYLNNNIMSLSAVQSHYNWLKNKTQKGHLKIEFILLNAEIEMKKIYYDLIGDLELDLIKSGVDSKNIKPL